LRGIEGGPCKGQNLKELWSLGAAAEGGLFLKKRCAVGRGALLRKEEKKKRLIAEKNT